MRALEKILTIGEPAPKHWGSGSGLARPRGSYNELVFTSRTSSPGSKGSRSSTSSRAPYENNAGSEFLGIILGIEKKKRDVPNSVNMNAFITKDVICLSGNSNVQVLA